MIYSVDLAYFDAIYCLDPVFGDSDDETIELLETDF